MAWPPNLPLKPRMSYLKTKYIIIGSGPTGIGAAYRLKEQKIQDFIVLEKSNNIGGLATSYIDKQGFTWDVGGHVQFSHYPYFDEAMKAALGENGWFHHQRESWIWIKNRFIPYPFQNNIHRLPDSDCSYCYRELEKVNGKNNLRPSNFKQWLEQSFGRGICEIFLYPYNFKVWAYDPKYLNYQWIGERVSTVDLKRIQNNIKDKKDDLSWGPNNTFQFPRQGGTGAIWSALANQIGLQHFRLNTEVLQIDPIQKVVTLSDQTTIKYEKLLSTMPIDQLTHITQHVPSWVTALSKKLLYSSTNIVGIGVEGKLPQELKTKCWMYFPENNCPFYRVTVFSNYSPHNVPDINNQFSLMTEISESPYRPVDKQNLVKEVIDGLYATKLLTVHDKIISKWQFHTTYGYPTPGLKRDEILQKVIPELEKLDIWSRGRFGGWKYEVSNQDHSFMQGVEWVDFIKDQRPEKTYRLT